MNKSLNTSYIVLVFLTLATGIIFWAKLPFALIMFLALIKFWLVGFQFMELKLAHPFWKGLFLIFSAILVGIIVLLA